VKSRRHWANCPCRAERHNRFSARTLTIVSSGSPQSLTITRAEINWALDRF
jgi:hypothetical protein